MPDEDDSFELPRWWLANLFNSVIGEAFSKWVREQVEKRNAKRKLDQNNEVEADPELLQILRASTDVSAVRGKGADMLKTKTKRRRTHKQVIKDKQATKQRD